MYMILFSFLNARWRSISSSALLSFFFPSFFLPLPNNIDAAGEVAVAAAVGCCAVRRQLSGGDAGYIMVLGHLLLHFFGLFYFHF